MSADNSKECLLVVDDSPDTRELLQRNLSSQGYEALTAADVAEALRILGLRHVDLVVTDLKMPGASGLDLVRHIRENLRETEVMMITGYPSVEGAVTAMKSGAGEYLSKPFTKEELLGAVGRVMEKLRLRRAGQLSPDRHISHPPGMVGGSEAMHGVYKAISRAASAVTPVLITGEHGTGKGLVARAVHHASSRADAPFATLDCAGHPAAVLERQLFGYTAESPPGKMESPAGFFRLVEGGTLYLKSIATLSGIVQAELLRVLEDKRSQRIGSTDTRPAGCRLIADSDRDLPALVDAGVFREDLLMRLSMNVIAVPALRERGNDVLLLARHFLDGLSKETGKPVPRLSDHVMEIMKHYSWPGNIGELQNVIYRLLRMTDTDVIDVPDLPSHMRFSLADASLLSRSLAQVEAEHIRNVMASVGGNKTRAAEILGINRKTLREKLAQAARLKPST